MTKDTSKFSTTPYVLKVEKPWGFELILSADNPVVTSKILHINAGKRISLQYHDVKQEVMTLLSGEGIIELEDKNGEIQKINMETRKGYLVITNQIHRVVAGATDCEILESSTPEKGNTIRLEDDYSRGTETEDDRLKNRS